MTRHGFERRKAQHTGLALLVALALAGCATRPTQERDGPQATTPPGLRETPDAVPRIEPIRIGGPNKPYEVFGERYLPLTTDTPFTERGLASWYGKKFHGRPTASGEVYNMYAMTAAHPTLPIPSYARVRNPANGREVIVRVNDRGPFHKGRVIDLSYTAALKLDLLRGVAPVELRRITHADIRAGRWAPAANEPPPTYVPDVPSGAPQRETTPGGGVSYWLQFGSFTRLDGAEALRQRVAEAELALLPLLTIVREAGRHQLRAGPFPSLEEARAAGAQLRGFDPGLVEKR